MGTQNRARVAMLVAALLFSTGGAAIKATSFGVLQVTGFRSLFAAMVLLAAVPSSRRGWSGRIGPVAVAYAVMLLLFVTSNKLTTAANAIFLQSTFPLYVVLLGPWLLGEARRRTDVGILVVMGLGTAVFAFSQDEVTAIATHPALGNLMAAGAGLFWGFTVMGLRWLVSSAEGGDGGGGAAAATVAGNGLAAVVALSLAWPWEVGTATDWGVMVFLGVVQVGLAYVCVTWAMRHLDALEASILLMSEPAMSPIWAWWVHGEVPSGIALVGGAVILSGLLLRALLSSRARAAAAPSS